MSSWKVEVTSMNLNEYIDKLKIEYPVYGDFLRFFTIKIGDLPSEFSTWLLKLGSFYDELQRIANNMLDAYVKFVLLQAGYVPIGLMEMAEEEVAEMGGNLKDKAIEVTEDFINDLLNGEDEFDTVDEYINLENLKECICIKLISFQPDIWDDKVTISILNSNLQRV